MNEKIPTLSRWSLASTGDKERGLHKGVTPCGFHLLTDQSINTILMKYVSGHEGGTPDSFFPPTTEMQVIKILWHYNQVFRKIARK